MKKIMASILVIIMMFSLGTTSQADNSKEVVKIGYIGDYGGIEDIQSVSKKGYLYDLFERIGDYCNYQFEFVKYSNYEQLSKGAKNNEFYYFGPIINTGKSIQGCTYALELTNCVISLVTKDEQGEFYYDDPSSIDGKTVASYEDNILENYLNDYCNENNISVDYIRGDIKNYDQIDADLYLTTSNYTKLEDCESVISLTTEPLYVATVNKDTTINQVVTKAFQDVVANDVNFLYDLHEKYFKDTSSLRRNLRKEETELLQNRQLKVAFESNHDFFSYLNKEGNPDGLLVNFVNEAVVETGALKPQYLPYSMNGKNQNSVDYIVENADIVISSLGKYSDFKDGFSLSDTYLDIPIILLVDQDLYYGDHQDNQKHKIGIVRNMFIAPDAISNSTFSQDIVIYDDIDQLNKDYDDDKIDGFYSSECARSCVNQNIERDFYTISSSASTPLKIWVSNELGRDFIEIANVVFDQVDPTAINELILQEQAKYKVTAPMIETIKDNLGFIAFIISLIIAGILIIIIIMQRNKQKHIKLLLEVDSLTGLMSKYKFTQELETLMKTATSKQYLLMALDIDNFKLFNKTHGVKKGDDLLKALGHVLFDNRKVFIHLCRYQNDQFIALIENKHDQWLDIERLKDYNVNFEENVKNIIEKKLNDLNVDNHVHFSVGIYIIENPAEKIDYMIDCVLTAKNVGKSTFGNTTILFTQEIKNKQNIKNEIISSMEKAIENEEFYIKIQPKVELETGKLIGGEVLVRWKKSDENDIYPDDFIPLFEQNHFIIKLDYYVLEKTCHFIHNTRIDVPVLSVNISAISMLQKYFVSNCISILKKYQIQPQQIEFELTESSLNINYEQILKTMKALKKLGFTIAIDDFGKGASSLARIRELDADVIKLDKEFIDTNVVSEKGKLVLHNIITMANGLGTTILAEGIETKQQQRMLIELGCKYGQGYYFNMPLSTMDFITQVEIMNKINYVPVLKNKRVSQFWSNFEKLHYGVAIAANDQFSTIIQANSAFFQIIGHTKEEFSQIHRNRLTEILFDNLYTMVKNFLDNKQYSFSYDLRILTAKKEIVWVHDIVEFDLENNLFFITFIDITKENKLISKDATYEEYSLQKEIARYANAQTFDYIYVTDVVTNELIYANENALKDYGFTDESQWKGVKYHKIIYGTDEPIYPEFYDNLNEDEFHTRENYNSFLQKHFLTRVKLVHINGVLMRIHIATDVSAKKKIEYDLKLQSTLLDCVEELYEHQNPRLAFTHILMHIKRFYGGDSTYYFEVNKHEKILDNIYAVTRVGIKDQTNDFKALSTKEHNLLVDLLAYSDNSYITIEQIKDYNYSSAIMKIFNDSQIKGILVTPIKDENHASLGFIGIGNPQQNHFKTDLIELLSRFISISHRNDELREYEKDALLAEENSKLSILNTCSNVLQLNSNSKEMFDVVLKMLRRHYEASFGMVIEISKDGKSFNIIHQNYNCEEKKRYDQKLIYDFKIIKSICDIFEADSNKAVTSLFNESKITVKERNQWKEAGIDEAYLSPIFKENNKIAAILILGNPKLTTRSLALVQVVAKFMADYDEKVTLHENHEEKISLDLLTGLYNKVSTEKKIKELLQEKCAGTMYMIDIDNFKEVNDTLGHIIGDKVIIDVAKILKDIFREVDIVGRVGGDEFMVFCPSLVSQRSIENKARMICEALKKTYISENDSVTISTSVGVCIETKNELDFETMYINADRALYQAKHLGKSQYCIASV